MDGALICNFEELRSLFGCQWTGKMDVSLDAIKHSLFGFALGAIGGVDFRVSQIDSNILERPPFASGVHADGHRSAGPQGGKQKIVR